MTHSELYVQTTRAVEDYLDAYFTKVTANAAGIHESYAGLWEHMSRLARGGKKIRPYLTMIGYGKYSPAILPVAAAHELLHTAILMHDDIVDEDTMRHGEPNINGIYQAKYHPHLSPEQSVHYSYAAGLLAGDALISEAYKLIANSKMPTRVTAQLIGQLHQSIFEVIGGELMDVEASIVHNADYDPMLIYRYKTAGYSFIGPLLSGAICHESSEEICQLLEEIGLQFGIAFQLQDDLLGIFGNEALLGKSVLLDLKEGKSTYLIAYHKEHMASDQQAHFMATFGNTDATDEALYQLQSELIASGAKQKTEERIDAHFEKARAKINKLTNALQRTELLSLIDFLHDRQA